MDSVFYEALPLAKIDNPLIDDTDDEQMVPAILKTAQEVQHYINQAYDVMAIRMFNVNNHRFDIKSETIAKSGFWITKKRYAQWIINDNTVNCDKIDVKGLDVRRSSFPIYFKTVMENVLSAILKGVDKSEIDKMILNYKADMPNQYFVNIAKNSSVKDMSKYMFKTQTIGQFTKGTPAHVKAAITYNELLKYFKTAYKYEPMKDGDKIKMLYLKNNPLGVEAVAINGYNDPAEIEKLITEYIDYDKMWESDLQNKLDDFYNAMKWDSPNPNLETFSTFFSF